MGITYGTSTLFQATKGIVQDGLVLNLDAGVNKSYPRNGTAWYDLAGSNSGTLINGPTFDRGNGGSINFDGTNDHVDLSNFNFFNYCDYNKPFSLCVRCKLSGTSNQEIMGHQLSGGTYRGIALQVWNGTFRFSMFKDLSNRTYCNSSDSSTNTYYDVVGTFNGSNHSTGFSVYVNGQDDLQSVNPIGTIDQSLEASDGLVLGVRGEISGSKDAWFGGTIYGVSIYNRELTAAEVLQNYNATKARFGL